MYFGPVKIPWILLAFPGKTTVDLEPGQKTANTQYGFWHLPRFSLRIDVNLPYIIIGNLITCIQTLRGKDMTRFLQTGAAKRIASIGPIQLLLLNFYPFIIVHHSSSVQNGPIQLTSSAPGNGVSSISDTSLNQDRNFFFPLSNVGAMLL